MADCSEACHLDDDVSAMVQQYNVDPMKTSPQHARLIVNLWAGLDSENDAPFLQLEERIGQLDDALMHLMNTMERTGKSVNGTLLQCACGEKRTVAVRCMLNVGVDPNQTSASNTTRPVYIAAAGGDHETLSCLVDDKRTRLGQAGSDCTVVHLVTERLTRRTATKRYVKCLDHLLQAAAGQKHHVDAESDDGNTAVVLLTDPTEKLQSLELDAHDGNLNTALDYAARSENDEVVMKLLLAGASRMNKKTIQLISPSVWETYFDSQCNKHPPSGNHIVTDYDYSIFLSALKPPSSTDTDSQRSSKPTKLLRKLGRSEEHEHLVKHQLVRHFVQRQWNTVRPVFHANLLFYSLTVLILTPYVLLANGVADYASTDGQFTKDVLWYVLVFFVVPMLSLRELFQMVVKCRRYFIGVENYAEMTMLCSIVWVLAAWGYDDTTQPYDAGWWRRFFSSIAVLLAWIEELLLLGRHPRMSVFVKMFTTVSRNLLSLVVWSLLLLFGFSCSFFVAYGPIDGKNDNGTAFATPLGSLLKVSAMMTGELDFSTWYAEAKVGLAFGVVFVAFLFLVTIVLLNLLLGMAVNDIQAIQSQAEVTSFLDRLELIDELQDIVDNIVRGSSGGLGVTLPACFDGFLVNLQKTLNSSTGRSVVVQSRSKTNCWRKRRPQTEQGVEHVPPHDDGTHSQRQPIVNAIHVKPGSNEHILKVMGELRLELRSLRKLVEKQHIDVKDGPR